MSDLSHCSVQKLAEDLAIVGARRDLATKAGRYVVAMHLANESLDIRRELSLIPLETARQALEADSALGRAEGYFDYTEQP